MADTALLTARQVAERLNKSSRTITRWALAGKLPVAHRLPGPNGAVLFSEDAVAAMEAS